MPRRLDLPAALRSRPFTVAEALDAGVRPGVLRGPRFRRPFHGVRVPVEFPDTLAVGCAALQLLLPPASCFGGRTALRLQELPLPLLSGDALAPVHVVLPPGAVPEIDGVGARQSRFVDQQRTVPVDGLQGHRLRVARPAQARADVAEDLALDDLVAVGDALRRRRADDAHLAAVVAQHAGDRGVVNLREALRHVRHPVDSRPETLVRMMLTRAGVPEPVVNQDVSGDGGWIGRPDLSWPAVEVAVEHDGDHHRTSRQQWRSDKARSRVMREHGWVVIELTADDLRTPGRTVAIVAAALGERGLTW